MIGRLTGTVLEKSPPLVLLEVGGVGYEIEMPLGCFCDLPECRERAVIRTHFAVREDAHTLYGFNDESERALFRALIRLSGVGPKLALGILSGMLPNEFMACIEAEDTKTLSRLPGVGKKKAERLVLELRGRLGEIGQVAALPSADARLSAPARGDTPLEEARSALVALGYAAPEVSRMLSRLDTEGLASEVIIREALRATVQRGESAP
jgi:Holliday junction DNA helicase RuvA